MNSHQIAQKYYQPNANENQITKFAYLLNTCIEIWLLETSYSTFCKNDLSIKSPNTDIPILVLKSE